MLKLPSALRSRNALVTAVGVVLIAGTTTVVAQTQPMEPIQWDKRRLDQLDRNVRRIERALTQRNAAGQPVYMSDPRTATTTVVRNPMQRIASRIQNRVESRIRNRIDRNYDPQANARTPFAAAEQETRAVGRRSR